MKKSKCIFLKWVRFIFLFVILSRSLGYSNLFAVDPSVAQNPPVPTSYEISKNPQVRAEMLRAAEIDAARAEKAFKTGMEHKKNGNTRGAHGAFGASQMNYGLAARKAQQGDNKNLYEKYQAHSESAKKEQQENRLKKLGTASPQALQTLPIHAR